jgi:acylphosphatase
MVPEDTIHRNIRITGRVQGVGFRYSARQTASSLDVKGFIRNMPDGDVYIEAEGSNAAVDEFLAWCRQGPPRARIEHLEFTDGLVSGFQEFLIR